ncbi:MAG: hemin uptake protein HemP [Microvirgula sp.]
MMKIAPPPTPPAPASRPEPPRLQSRELFGSRNEILIEHQGETYRLRLTRNDKLILTK